jgi:hypothetical protein
MIGFRDFWPGSGAQAMLAHRQVVLTPPECTKINPLGGLARSSIVVARLL